MAWERSRLLLAAFVLGCASAAPQHGYGGIGIQGDARFVARTREALSLLESRAPSAFELARRNLSEISSAERSGLNPYSRGVLPKFEVGSATASASITWYAGAIAHDSYHAALYLDYIERNGRPIPDEAWTGPDAERAALEHQLETMRLLGGPDHEIEYLLRSDGSHHDLNQDGFYGPTDYERRSW